MDFQLTHYESPYPWLFFLTTLVTWLIAFVIRRQRNKPGNIALSLMLLAMGVWSLGVGFEFMAASLAGKFFWVRIAWIGVAFVPPLLLTASLHLTSQYKILNASWFPLLWLLPSVTVGLVFTNDWHHLLWLDLFWISPAENLFAYNVGWWFWVHIVFANITVMAAVFFFIRLFRRQRGVFRGQALASIPALLLPWLANVVYLLGIGPPVDLTSMAFGLTGLLIRLAFLRFRLLDLRPVSRDRLLQEMREGVLSLDGEDQVVDINHSLVNWANLQVDQVIGLPVAFVFAQWPEFVAWLETDTARPCEFQTPASTYLEFRASPLRAKDGAITGRLILVQDITARKQAELALKQTLNSLEQRVSDQTTDLRATNERLRQEMEERAQAEAAVRALTQTLEQRVLARTRELSTLYEVSAAANRPLALPSLLTEMLSKAVLSMPAAQGAVFLGQGSPHLSRVWPVAVWGQIEEAAWEAVG